MVDYVPSMVTEMDVRNFVTPPIENTDVSKAEILIQIESVEKYISLVYGVSAGDGRIPCLLLIVSKLLTNPTLARKYYTLSSEKLDSYAYSLAQPISRGTDIQSSPYIISKTWEKMAIEMLESLSKTGKYDYYFIKVND